MEERIKEMKKRYAKIKHNVQRSERAAKARSHVQRKLAEQRALQNAEATTQHLKERSNDSCPSTMSRLDQCSLPETDLKRSSHYLKHSKSSVSFSLEEKANLEKNSSEGKESDSIGVNQVGLEKSHGMQINSEVHEGIKLRDTEHVGETDKKTIEKDVLLSNEVTVIKESQESPGRAKSSQVSSSKPEKQFKKQLRRSRDMEYLAPSLKESMEFDSCGNSSHTWMDDMPYPAEYYVRRTRSMKWKEWSGTSCKSAPPNEIKDSPGTVSEKSSIPDKIKKAEHKPPEVCNSQSSMAEGKIDPSTHSSDSDQSQSILQTLCASSDPRMSIRKQRKKSLRSSKKGSKQIAEVGSVSSNDSPTLENLACQSASESAVQIGNRRRSKLSRRKVKSCDNSPLDVHPKGLVSMDDNKCALNSTKALEFSDIDRSDEKVVEPSIKNQEKEPISSNQQTVSRAHSQYIVSSSNEKYHQIFPKYPHHHLQISADFFLPDSEFVRLKVAKVRNSPVMARQSPKHSVEITNTSCKFLDLENDAYGDCIQSKTKQKHAIKANPPEIVPTNTDFQFEECYSESNEISNENQQTVSRAHSQYIVSSSNEKYHQIFPKYPHHHLQKSADFFLPDSEFVRLKVAKVRNSPVMARQSPKHSVEITNTSCKFLDLENDAYGDCIQSKTKQKHAIKANPPEIVPTNTDFQFEECYSESNEISNENAERPITDEHAVTQRRILEDNQYSSSLDLLCSEGSSALVSDVPSVTGNGDSLLVAGLNSEPLVSSCSDGKDLTIQYEEHFESCKQLEEKYVEIHKDNSSNTELMNERDNDVMCPGKELMTENVENNSEVGVMHSNLERDRERTPVDLMMKDSIGSNVTQESPFSGVATGTPPQPAEFPNAQALCGKSNSLEVPAVQFTGCLSHDIDGSVICFDAINCVQHELMSLVVVVCFKRSLVLWSEKDGCWAVEATLDLTQAESFDSVCLVCINQNIWLTTGGIFASSCLRLFYLNIDGKHTLQEHLITESDSCVRGHISTLCSIADVGIAGASYQCQFNRSTLSHIPLDVYSSDIATEVCEVGIYSGKVSSVLEVTGTQHWIVGLSKDDVILGNLKLGQIVKCISWPTHFPEAPECLKASTEEGLLFLVLGCQDNGGCSRLDVVNPEAGRTSTLLEYRNTDKQQLRYVSAAADDKYLAMCFSDGSVSIWSVYSGQLLVDIREPTSEEMPTSVRLLESKTNDKTLLCVGSQNCVHLHALNLLN